MKIKIKNLYLAGTVLIILFGALFLLSGSGKAVSQILPDGEVQTIKLSVNGGNYVLEPAKIKKGIPAKIEADLINMPGCSKSIVIPSMGISKTFSSKDNVLEFVPDKAGTFNIACSMNMYKGTFEVLDTDGTASNYVEQKLNAGSSCGMGGGCGCGG